MKNARGVVLALLFLITSAGPAFADCVPNLKQNTPAEAATIERWTPTTRGVSRDMGVPADLIERVMYVESSGNQWAYSSAGAIGLMQTMPFHWFRGENPWDPYQNIRKGAGILLANYRTYGNWVSAVRAYAGAGPVANAYVYRIFWFACTP